MYVSEKNMGDFFRYLWLNFEKNGWCVVVMWWMTLCLLEICWGCHQVDLVHHNKENPVTQPGLSCQRESAQGQNISPSIGNPYIGYINPTIGLMTIIPYCLETLGDERLPSASRATLETYIIYSPTIPESGVRMIFFVLRFGWTPRTPATVSNKIIGKTSKKWSTAGRRIL